MSKAKFVTTALAMLLLFGSVFVAGASAATKDDKTEKAKKIAKKIEKDLEEKGEYSEEDLEMLLTLLEDIAGVKLKEKQKELAKSYIIGELKKTIKNKKFRQKIGKTEPIARINPKVIEKSEGYITYDIGAQSYGGPSTYKQILKDITGGSGTDDNGNSFNINGNNDLIQVDVEGVPPLYNTFIYTLTYKDEDHPDPTLDALYDQFRKIWYGRIEDIESFTVYVWGEIVFDGIWSNDQTFAASGQHGDATFSGGPSTVYIAVWNHAMDINDDNPSLAKTNMP